MQNNEEQLNSHRGMNKIQAKLISQGKVAMDHSNSSNLQQANKTPSNQRTPGATKRRFSNIGTTSTGINSTFTNNRKEKIQQLKKCVSGNPMKGNTNSAPDKRIATSFSITYLNNIISQFSIEKQDIVKSIGFEVLLKLLPQSHFPRQLALWLLKRIDYKTGALKLRKNCRMEFNEYDVEIVIGLPRKIRTVRTSLEISQTEVSKIKKLLLVNTDRELSLEIVEEILTRNYGSKMTVKEREAFKVAFVLCADAYFLGPKGQKAKINQEMYSNLVNPEMISEFNWCAYVIYGLIQSAKRVQQSIACGSKTVIIDGCLLFLVVFYFDNLNFGDLTPTKKLLPRVLDYPIRLVRSLEKEDRQHMSSSVQAEYGRHEVLPDNEVMYSRNRFYLNNKDRDKDQVKGQHDDITIEVTSEQFKSILDKWSNDVKKITDHTHSEILQYFKQKCTQEHGEKGGTSGNIETYAKDLHTPQRKQITISVEETEGVKEQSSVGNSSKNEVHKTSFLIDSPGFTESERHRISGSYKQISIKKSRSWEDLFDDDSSTSGILKQNRLTSSERKFNSALKREVIQKLQELGWSDKDHGEIEDTDGTIAEEFECPTPLLMVTPSLEQAIVCHRGDEDATKHGNENFNSDIKVVIQYINNKPMFGVSPFAIGMNHPDAPLEAQLQLQIALYHLDNADLERTWYLHMSPSIIGLDGRILEASFQGKVDFVPKIVDAIFRMYEQMDSKLYKKWNENRWRHFLPTDFAVWALNNNTRQPCMVVQDLFLPEQIEYNVQHCRLVVAPLLVDWKWCLYIWDFERNKVVVVDPRGMKQGTSELKDKHKSYLMLMKSGMNECWQEFYKNNLTLNGSWETEYIDINGGYAGRLSTGMYSVFYARCFDGEVMTRVLTKEATQMQRVKLLYQLLKMEGNTAKPPTSILKAIDNCM